MKTNILFMTLLLLVFPCQGQTVTDIDGNIYNTVTIGNQVWMKENLRVTKFNDGTEIPVVTDNIKWSELSTPATCTFNNTNNNDTILPYGRLYNWFSVDNGTLCPQGWKVPSNDDWNELVTYLGGMESAHEKLKETGTKHWLAPNTADNSTGFTALPGGFRHPWFGTFWHFGNAACIWSTSEYNDKSTAGYLCIEDELNFASVEKGGIKQYGNSVRCIEDKNTFINKDSETGNISVYPNPAKDILYIRSVEAIQSALEIVNLHGALVYKSNNISNSINIKNLKSGIYLLRLAGSRDTRVVKIVKE